jgi:hypothetical protein
MRFRLGDDVMSAPAGSFAFIPPRRRAHVAERKPRAGPPPRDEGAVRARAVLRALRRATEQAANLDTFRALAPEAGMTVVGPPLAQSHPDARAGEGLSSNQFRVARHETRTGTCVGISGWLDHNIWLRVQMTIGSGTGIQP